MQKKNSRQKCLMEPEGKAGGHREAIVAGTFLTSGYS